MARNTRQVGNRAENAFMAMAERLGYCAFAARGSRGVIDVVCFADLHKRADTAGRSYEMVSLVVQVGTAAKPVAATLAELDAAARPIGSLCVVARRMPLKHGRREWKFHTEHGTFPTLAAAVVARTTSRGPAWNVTLRG